MSRTPGLAAVAIGAATVAAAGAGIILLAGGCRRADDGAAIQERLRAKGTADVVREAAAAHYAPPADGRLANAQIRMYLEVRERESRIREAAAVEARRRREAAARERPERVGRGERQDGRAGRGPGTAVARADDSGLAAADLRAVQELHVNSKEYAWVRDRVLEAEAAATTQALYQKMTAGRELLLARMRRDRDALTDPAQRAAEEREIDDFKRGLQTTEPAISSAVRANVALLARFRDPLAHLRALEERAVAASAGLEAPGTGATGTGH